MKKIIIIATALFSTILVNAQQSKLSLSLRLGHEDDVFPGKAGSIAVLHKVPIRPKVVLGVEYIYRTGKRSIISQDVALHYHRHPYQERNMGIGTNLSYQFIVAKKFFIAPRLGVHLSNSKPINPEYKYNESSKVWESVKSYYPATNRLYVPLSLEVGYNLSNKYKLLLGANRSLLTPFIKDIQNINLYKGYYIGVNWKL